MTLKSPRPDVSKVSTTVKALSMTGYGPQHLMGQCIGSTERYHDGIHGPEVQFLGRTMPYCNPSFHLVRLAVLHMVLDK